MHIPKIIHHIWVGPAPLPAPARHYIGTWRHHHPGWRMRLWTDDNPPPLRNRALYDGFTNPGARSDILRYELLARFGGVYADTDVECLRPLDPLARTATAFLGDIAPQHTETGPQRLEIAVLAAAPGHPFFAQVLAHLEPWAQAFRPFTSALSTGPQFLERQLALWGHRPAAGTPGSGVTRLPPACFYPFGWQERPAPGARFPDSYALHHWWGSWHTDAVEPVGPVCTLLSERLYPRFRQFMAALPPEERAAAEAVLLDECRGQAASANDFYRLAAATVLANLPQAEARALRERLCRDRNAAVAETARRGSPAGDGGPGVKRREEVVDPQIW
ncbi:MAG: hypothetical protein JO250_20615 [Armatimonadetes bacterium]|nr:hypothetical protein [Armatimonadota bacterium]